MTLLVFLLLTTHAVWAGTDQQPDSVDELRTLAGALAAIIIYAGTIYLTGGN